MKYKIKIIIYTLFICFLSLFLVGCSNYSEINNVGIVESIGIERIENKYHLSFNIYEGNDEYKIYDIYTDNLENSFNDIYLLINKKLYLSHLNTLLLSNELSDDDILDVFNLFNSQENLRGSFLVILINNYNDNVFNTPINEIINNNYLELGYTYPVSFNEILREYLDIGISYIPIYDNLNHEVLGMKSVFLENKLYLNQDSQLLNLVRNKINNLNLFINNENIILEDINVSYFIDKNEITIKINFKEESNINKEILRNNIINLLNSFFSKDINLNYFRNIIKKNNYSYYLNNLNIKIKFNYEINIDKEFTNNIKDGDIFEKDK